MKNLKNFDNFNENLFSKKEDEKYILEIISKLKSGENSKITISYIGGDCLSTRIDGNSILSGKNSGMFSNYRLLYNGINIDTNLAKDVYKLMKYNYDNNIFTEPNPVTPHVAWPDEYTQKNIDIFKAAGRGYLDKVKELIENGADINQKNDDGDTALILASFNYDIKMVKYLVDKGANIELTNKKGFDAYFYGNNEIKKYLNSKLGTNLDQRKKLNISDDEVSTTANKIYKRNLDTKEEIELKIRKLKRRIEDLRNDLNNEKNFSTKREIKIVLAELEEKLEYEEDKLKKDFSPEKDWSEAQEELIKDRRYKKQ